MATTEPLNRPVSRVAKELVASSGFLLARLGFGFKGKAIQLVEDAGGEIHDYGLLAILAEGTRETQGTIAAALALDPSRLVALLDGLEERGLIARQRDPLDRRRHVVSITTAGKRELVRLRGLIQGLEAEYFAPLDTEERKTLHELLVRLARVHDPGCAFQETKPV
jgi:DNA-binding MarR family transcriptional regulator